MCTAISFLLGSMINTLSRTKKKEKKHKDDSKRTGAEGVKGEVEGREGGREVILEEEGNEDKEGPNIYVLVDTPTI